MAWTTVLDPDQTQIDYRLSEGAGCDRVNYRLADGDAAPAMAEQDKGRGLTWIGDGLAELGLAEEGIAAGLPLTTEHHKAARALLDGCHPGTGERLVDPKKAAHPPVAPGRHPVAAACSCRLRRHPARRSRRARPKPACGGRPGRRPHPSDARAAARA
ncbi:hypothetical protein [Nonomuraea sp. B19D2]|uniref:hypothetical protein n=1 Tax=Nonomuraea sp. B19D2 TaxID=3159561 RepID=UPI0032DA4877